MSKPALSYRDQLDKLRDRGLRVEDEDVALQCLANLSYYRLSIYWRVFTQENDHDRFRPGTTFAHIWQLYQFDRELRRLVNEACKRLEISVRSRWAYELAHEFGSQAYENPSIFNHKPTHTKLLAGLDARFEESKEDFVLHYKGKHCHRPEIWVMIELFDFGTLRYLYNATKQAHTRQRIAAHYDLPEKVFSSLLKQCNYLRNLCAHHGRLWNRKLTFKLALPDKKPKALIPSLLRHPPEEEIESRKLYNTLVLLSHVSARIEPGAKWGARMQEHLKTLPTEHLPQMGFPSDWEARPIWK